MDLRRLHPTDPRSQVGYQFYPSSAKIHYLHLLIAIILTTLHLTPLIITNPQNQDAIIFAQPYIIKWLMVPYAAYYTIIWHSLVEVPSWKGRVGSFLDGSEAIITEPRAIIRNLRLGQLTYLLSGCVLIWDVPYLWFTYIVCTLWNALPPYSFGDLGLELSYLLAAVLVIVTFAFGPVPVVSLVVSGGRLLREEVIKVEGLCRERLEREKGS